MKTPTLTFVSLGIVILAGLASLTSCQPPRTPGAGLTLPEGDAARGEATFIALRCHRCHTVHNLKLPEYQAPISERRWEDPVVLGGEVMRVKTYGELVTSIINPSHFVEDDYKEQFTEDSPMPNLANQITVSQLIDLVTFLDAHYEEMQPDYTPMPILTPALGSW